MPQTHPNNDTAIRELQTYLQQLSFFEERIPYVPVNGRFDQNTRRALMIFQTINRLPITGIADLTTWETLYAAYLASRINYRPSVSISPFPPYPDAYAISAGEESDLVWILRHMLNSISVDYAKIGPLADSRIYDASVERAVHEFQAQNHLPRTGRVDLLTWNRLAEEYNRLAHIKK